LGQVAAGHAKQLGAQVELGRIPTLFLLEPFLPLLFRQANTLGSILSLPEIWLQPPIAIGNLLLGPVGETYTLSPSGSGLYPFQDNPAAIYTIANTGAMLSCGQKRSKGNAALAAESGCGSDFNFSKPLRGPSRSRREL